jgi:hypothetical protein
MRVHSSGLAVRRALGSNAAQNTNFPRIYSTLLLFILRVRCVALHVRLNDPFH